ncbi:MAG: hypothetical protein GX620_16600 [Chloroflexi bacterium]|nr:hypothetical protein [Chloroflexota bacterium]
MGPLDFWGFLLLPFWVHQLLATVPSWRNTALAFWPIAWYLFLLCLATRAIPSPGRADAYMVFRITIVSAGAVMSLVSLLLLHRALRCWHRFPVLSVWLVILFGAWCALLICLYDNTIPFPRWNRILVALSVVVATVAVVGTVLATWSLYRVFQGWYRVLPLPVWLAIVLGTVNVVSDICVDIVRLGRLE